MFDGFPGSKGGFLDNWLSDYAETNMGRAALKAAKDSLGEGLEEFTSGMVQPYLAKMWNGDERDFWQTLGESAPDALYDGFLGTVTSFGMSAPGNYSNLQNAYIVDAALDILDHGGTLSNAQLAQATAAAKELTSSWGDPDRSRWSRNVLQQWTDARNGYFDRQFSQTANSSGNAVDLSEIDTSNLIMFPMLNDTKAQTNAAADSNAIPFPMANSAVAAQSGQPDSSNLIMLPMFNSPAAARENQTDFSNLIMLPLPKDLQTQASAAAGDNSVLFPGTNNALTQNGQIDVSETISQTGLPQNAVDVPIEFTAEKAAGENTLQAAPAADTASPEMIAEQNAKIHEQALEKCKAKDGGQAEMSPETKNAPENTGKMGETSFFTEEMSVEKKKDVANAAPKSIMKIRLANVWKP